ncbi:MAG TPA: FtsK/SpoIIIE domain-containing protein [Ktedonobacteraceae bacterium]|nr:FtsK/SpoIIIE domain-containing protein [Ktedonobacteraceae bacterium]
MTQQQAPIIISRKARFWPEIPHHPVAMPMQPSEPTKPAITTIITLLLSVAGIGVSGFIFSKISNGSNLFIFAFLAMGVFAAIGSLLTFVTQARTVRKQRKYLLAAYKAELRKTERQLQFLQHKERQARIELDPPFVPPTTPTTCYDDLSVQALFMRDYSDQDMTLWSRRPDDPDFLNVRIGMGNQPASYEVTGEQDKARIMLPNFFDTCNAYAAALMQKYRSLVAPITVKLNEHGPLAITGSARNLTQARELARAIACRLVYHHSPEDVRLVVLAPASQAAAWQWATVVPHSQLYEPGQSSFDASSYHAVALGPEDIVEQLPWISRELGRRELLLGDSRFASASSILPHLVIIIDHFEASTDLDPPPLTMPVMNFGQTSASLQNRSRLTVSPLKRAEMTLALSRGKPLGVSVVCVCASKTDVPVSSGIIIDLDVEAYPDTFSSIAVELPNLDVTKREAKQQKKAERRKKKQGLQPIVAPTLMKPQACVRMLQPDPPSLHACDLLDNAPIEALNHLAARMQYLQPAIAKHVELRTLVDLRSLFEPVLDIGSYNPSLLWSDATWRTVVTAGKQRAITRPLLRIPIGQKIGDEIQYLDLLKDGPHGLLIGQTGSGKSELLQTIIMSLSLIYRPNEITFLLIDYKAGLALEPFRHLPHTIGFLSNVSSPALIARFITMLRAEAIRREKRHKEWKEGKAAPPPHLIIIIDEFAEMAKRTETVLDELFTITRVGREIGMHLLLSAQRPEGIIGTKVRDYVQYRLCLRCASPDDSREVLGRVDAANLPVSIPGRGYLLHGDNQLDLFQAARSTVPVPLM